MTKKSVALGAMAMVIGLAATGAQADVLIAGTGQPYALTSTSYSQDFNSLAPSTQSAIPADALPIGWQILETGKNANGTYQVGSASSATAGSWSYGLGGASDRALGGRVSPDMPLIRVGAIFQNDLGGVIDSLAISYTGEQWQNGFNRATLAFEYSLDATSIDNGIWTSFSDLDFLAPSTAAHTGSKWGVSATNGNTAAFRTDLSGLIDGLSIGAGDTFGLRWTLIDIDPVGVTTDDGLAIDDFHLTASLAPAAAVPEPATWAMMIGGFGLAGTALRRKAARSRLAFA